jgi:hypothetical protein
VSAGGGFPGIELVKEGYDLVCTDGFVDEVELFNQKAEALALSTRCAEVFWKDLPNMYEKESFDFLFCRGNSFIYADGGWNSMLQVKSETSMRSYQDTLQIFYDLLRPGAWIYIDKFKDMETSHYEKVCEIEVGDNPIEELIFWTERFPEKNIRQASMIRKSGDVEKKTPNITYNLSGEELESTLKTVGFKNIEKISLPSEDHFSVWIAQK